MAATAMVRTFVQPRPGPSIRVNTTPNRKVTARAWPIGSMLRIVADLDSGTKIAVRMIAAAQIGRLIQNTDRQPIHSISRPPTIGPSAIDMPTTPPQTPSARARSTRPTNTCEMSDSATGFSIEPPTACMKRAAISISIVGARLHSSDPSAKTVSPIWKVRLRPKRSPAAPDRISSDASTSV